MRTSCTGEWSGEGEKPEWVERLPYREEDAPGRSTGRGLDQRVTNP